MELYNEIENLCINAGEAATKLALLSTEKKNEALIAISNALRENALEIIVENNRDLEAAEKNGVAAAMLDRLTLNIKRIEAICNSLKDVARLDDPIGKFEEWDRPSGLHIKRVRVPLGVVAMIYEARPNVTPDAATLSLKSGNAVILRGGKEAINSNKAIVKIIGDTLEKSGFSRNTVSLIENTTRESANILMGLRGYVDVLIPRGGKGLIKNVVENSKVPVIETGAGNCHLYVDESADIDMALKVALNAKCQRPSVCNAV